MGVGARAAESWRAPGLRESALIFVQRTSLALSPTPVGEIASRYRRTPPLVRQCGHDWHDGRELHASRLSPRLADRRSSRRAGVWALAHGQSRGLAGNQGADAPRTPPLPSADSSCPYTMRETL